MAYKALAKKYHPDVYQGDKAFAENKMKQINEAYHILSSPTLRAEYDRQLKQQAENQHSQYGYCDENHSAPVQPSQAQYKHPPKNFLRKLIQRLLPVFVIILAFSIAIVVGEMGFFQKSDKETTQNTPSAVVPRSGEILSGSKYIDASEITVTASKNADCVVKLKTSKGVTRISFYVRAGETVTVGVPAEYLYVYFASGDTWYGKSKLFGENTYYSKDEELLDFKRYSWEYTLTSIYGGNFDETRIDADEFNK